MREIKSKKYYEQRDVLKKYVISRTTFKNKSKIFKTKFPNININPRQGVWLIPEQHIKEFKPTRKPNRNVPKSVKNWVLNETWDYIGCISPRLSTRLENKERIETIFNHIKRDNRGKDFVLFYSIEKNDPNKNQEYNLTFTHIHFLIQLKNSNPFVRRTKKILDIYCHNNTFLESYNGDKWELEGKQYTVKDMLSWGERNYDYLIYKPRKK